MKKLLLLLLCVSFIFFFGGMACPRRRPRVADAGVFKSVNFGESWKQIARLNEKENITRVSVLVLTINPLNPNIIFLGTKGNGVIRTENGGDNWLKTPLTIGEFYSIAIDPQDDSNVYAAGFIHNRGKIFKSRDGGRTWQEIYAETYEGSKVLALAINPTNPSEIYAGNTGGALFKSSDGGESWVVQKWMDKKPIKKILFGLKDSRKIYVVLEDALFKSSDGGKSWEDLTPNFARFKDANRIYGLALDPYYEDGLFSASAYGLLKSTDGGKSWAEIPLLVRPGTSVLAIALNPKDSREIYLGLDSTMYISRDGGKSWATRHITSSIIKVLAVDPKTPSIIYVGVELREEKK